MALGRVLLLGSFELSHSESMLRGWLHTTLLSWSASTIDSKSVHSLLNIRPRSTASPATILQLLKKQFKVNYAVCSSLQLLSFTSAVSSTHIFCYTHRQL